MVEVEVKQVESTIIEKIEPKNSIDISLMKKKSSAKSFGGMLIGRMKQAHNCGNMELAILFQELYYDYKRFNETAIVNLKGWQGKSSLHIIQKPDYFEVYTWQKSDKYSKPHQVKRDVSKEEVNQVINAINYLNKEDYKIPTREIGELVYQKDWDLIFADRFTHIQLNTIMRILDFYGFIDYRGGKTKVLNKIESIQLALK